MNRNSMERRGVGVRDFWSRGYTPVVESLFSCVAELMCSFSTHPPAPATGTFLGGQRLNLSCGVLEMPSPSQLFPWGFYGKEADTRPGEGETDSASFDMRGVDCGFVPNFSWIWFV